MFHPQGETKYGSSTPLSSVADGCRPCDLTSPTDIGRSVADFAFGWGVNSLASFYRAF
jgi:hypothetical protein